MTAARCGPYDHRARSPSTVLLVIVVRVGMVYCAVRIRRPALARLTTAERLVSAKSARLMPESARGWLHVSVTYCPGPCASCSCGSLEQIPGPVDEEGNRPGD